MARAKKNNIPSNNSTEETPVKPDELASSFITPSEGEETIEVIAEEQPIGEENLVSSQPVVSDKKADVIGKKKPEVVSMKADKKASIPSTNDSESVGVPFIAFRIL